LLVAILCGADVSLYSVEVGVTARAGDLELTLDPVFVAWMPASVYREVLLHSADACAVGDMIFMRSVYRLHEYTPTVLRHEATHVRQQRALGLCTPLLYPFVNMEGEPGYSAAIARSDIALFTASIETMWLPPTWLPPLWHVLTFKLL
jgi:hypothetical protein